MSLDNLFFSLLFLFDIEITKQFKQASYTPGAIKMQTSSIKPIIPWVCKKNKKSRLVRLTVYLRSFAPYTQTAVKKMKNI